jgi:hypothetical protein
MQRMEHIRAGIGITTDHDRELNGLWRLKTGSNRCPYGFALGNFSTQIHQVQENPDQIAQFSIDHWICCMRTFSARDLSFDRRCTTCSAVFDTTLPFRGDTR